MGDYRVYTAADVHTLRFKRLAQQHLAELDSRIEELQAMRSTLADLARRCHGDRRPECPILDDLSRLPRPE